LLSLTVIRVLPVALALVGTGQSLASRLFLGWFGPRGLASVVFAVSVLDEPEIQGRVELFGIAVWTVLLSIVLHGMTAGWLARRYGEAALRRG
ncbi:MAG: cation:proton antiporter, partial [Planctomycetota bacterium]